MVAAGRVVPRQPVSTAPAARRRGTAAPSGSSPGSSTASLRVDDALRPARRSRREQDLRDRVRADAVARRVNRRRGRRLQRLKRRRGSRAGADVDTASSTPPEATSSSARRTRAFGREHQARLSCGRTPAGASELCGLQRVGRRDWRVRHADVHRGQREQRRARCCCPRGSGWCVGGEAPQHQALREPRTWRAPRHRSRSASPPSTSAGVPAAGSAAAPGTPGRAPRPPSDPAGR